MNKFAVFNNLDLSALDTKAKVVEALSTLPKIHEPEKFLSQKPSGEILKLVTTINQNHSEQMERIFTINLKRMNLDLNLIYIYIINLKRMNLDLKLKVSADYQVMMMYTVI